MPQAYYNAKAGIRKLTTETGAGQWGTALAFACALFDLECEVWQVRASYDAKPYRRSHDGDLRRHRAPLARPELTSGRPRLRRGPDSPGRSASRSARRSRWPRSDPDTNYALGSVLNHVLLHQTVIGEEALLPAGQGRRAAPTCDRLHRRRVQLRRLAFPFLREKLAGG